MQGVLGLIPTSLHSRLHCLKEGIRCKKKKKKKTVQNHFAGYGYGGRIEGDEAKVIHLFLLYGGTGRWMYIKTFIFLMQQNLCSAAVIFSSLDFGNC